jgi:hypothetical protein
MLATLYAVLAEHTTETGASAGWGPPGEVIEGEY